MNTDHIFGGFCITRPEGIGMGLAIGRSMIEAHSGEASPNQPYASILQFTMPRDAERNGGDDGW
jgi:nitrogen-specific signal transduction histidine kinase